MKGHPKMILLLQRFARLDKVVHCCVCAGGVFFFFFNLEIISVVKSLTSEQLMFSERCISRGRSV